MNYAAAFETRNQTHDLDAKHEEGDEYTAVPSEPASLHDRPSHYDTPYIAYVDISAKVEQWNKASAIARSNSRQLIYLVLSKVKQRLRAFLLARHEPKSVTYRVVALFLYLAVKNDLSRISQVVFDRDYSGEHAEAAIRNLFLGHLRRSASHKPVTFLRFENLRGTKADHEARGAYEGKKPDARIVGYAELEALLKE